MAEGDEALVEELSSMMRRVLDGGWRSRRGWWAAVFFDLGADDVEVGEAGWKREGRG